MPLIIVSFLAVFLHFLTANALSADGKGALKRSSVRACTGRKGRLIRQKGSEGGTTKVRYEARNASGVKEGALMDMINVHERELFLSGDKFIAIISEAASAGISLHSDRSVGLCFNFAVQIVSHVEFCQDYAVQNVSHVEFCQNFSNCLKLISSPRRPLRAFLCTPTGLWVCLSELLAVQISCQNLNFWKNNVCNSKAMNQKSFSLTCSAVHC